MVNLLAKFYNGASKNTSSKIGAKVLNKEKKNAGTIKVLNKIRSTDILRSQNEEMNKILIYTKYIVN